MSFFKQTPHKIESHGFISFEINSNSLENKYLNFEKLFVTVEKLII